MISIRNKRLMNYDGIENNIPTMNDFTFFGGGGKGGGGKTKVVYVPQVVKETVVKKAPDSSQQASALDMGDAGETEDDGTGGRKKSLGGTRKLAIPVTTSR